MSSPQVYDDLNNTDLGEKIIHLQNRNEKLLQHIQTLENDVARLCGELTQMKVNEDNLKRNISELFNTAKLEIQRKERMIADLHRQLDDLIFKRNTAKSFNRVNNSPNVDDTNKRSRDCVLSESNVNKKQKYESTNNKAILIRGESSEKESGRSSSKSPARQRDIDTPIINKRIEAVRKRDDKEHQQHRRTSRGNDRSRSREYSRSNSKEYHRSRSKDQQQSRSQNGHQSQSKKRHRSKSKECLRSKSKERRRSQSKEHHRSKSKEYDQIPRTNKNGELKGHSASKKRTVYKSRAKTMSIDDVKKETVRNEHIEHVNNKMKTEKLSTENINIKAEVDNQKSSKKNGINKITIKTERNNSFISHDLEQSETKKETVRNEHIELVNNKMKTEKLSTENINIKAEVDDQKSSKKNGKNTITIKTERNNSFISQELEQSERKTIAQSTPNLLSKTINEVKPSYKLNSVSGNVDDYKNATETSSSSKTTDNYSKSISCKQESTSGTSNTEHYQSNPVTNNENSNVISQNTIDNCHRQVDSKVSQTSIKTEIKHEASESSIEEIPKCTIPVSKINNDRTIINARRRRCVIKIVN